MVVNSVRMVVISNAIVVMAAKTIKGRAVAKHIGITASVFSKQHNAVVAKPNQWRMRLADVIGIALYT